MMKPEHYATAILLMEDDRNDAELGDHCARRLSGAIGKYLGGERSEKHAVEALGEALRAIFLLYSARVLAVPGLEPVWSTVDFRGAPSDWTKGMALASDLARDICSEATGDQSTHRMLMWISTEAGALGYSLSSIAAADLARAANAANLPKSSAGEVKIGETSVPGMAWIVKRSRQRINQMIKDGEVEARLTMRFTWLVNVATFPFDKVWR